MFANQPLRVFAGEAFGAHYAMDDGSNVQCSMFNVQCIASLNIEH